MIYTNFAYSNLKLSAKSIPINGEITISATIANTGKRAGKETDNKPPVEAGDFTVMIGDLSEKFYLGK